MVRTNRRCAAKRVATKRTSRRTGAKRRSLGSGITPVTALGQVLAFPKKVGESGKPDSGKWWIEGLKWAGYVVMQLITTLLTAEAMEAHRKSYPLLGLERFTEAATVVGCVQVLYFGATDIIARSPVCRIVPTDTTALGSVTTVAFRQERLKFVHFRITPGVPVTKRGGLYAVALLPITEIEAETTVERGRWTFSRVCNLPGAMVQATAQTANISYVPKVSDFAYQWKQLGVKHPEFALKLFIAYEDFSANTADTSAEYSLTESAFHVSWRGGVHLREMENERVIRSTPYSGLNSEVGIATEYGRDVHQFDLDASRWVDGVIYHNPLEEVCPSPSDFESLEAEPT